MALAESYGLRAVPTLIFFKDGKVREQIVSKATREAIETALSKQLL